MEEAARSIARYHQAFLVCLAGALICLALAAALYVVLHVREAAAYLSGSQRRRWVKEMEEKEHEERTQE